MKFVALALALAATVMRPVYRDVTSATGITWRQFNGESPDRFLVESTTGGVAFLDYDGDGLLDILFVNGGETPRGRSRAPVRHARAG